MRLEMCPRSSLKPSRRRRLIPPLRQRAAPACRLTRAVAEGGGMRTAANASPAAGCWLLAAEAAPGRPEARFLTQTRATVHAARGRRVHGVRPTLWRGKQCRGAAVRQCRRLAAQPAARGACVPGASFTRACAQAAASPGRARPMARVWSAAGASRARASAAPACAYRRVSWPDALGLGLLLALLPALQALALQDAGKLGVDHGAGPREGCQGRGRGLAPPRRTAPPTMRPDQ